MRRAYLLVMFLGVTTSHTAEAGMAVAAGPSVQEIPAPAPKMANGSWAGAARLSDSSDDYVFKTALTAVPCCESGKCSCFLA